MPIGNRVADDETFAAPHILIAHGRKLDLAGRIEDIEQRGLSIDYGLLLVRVFDRGIVIIQEAMADELQCYRCKAKMGKQLGMRDQIIATTKVMTQATSERKSTNIPGTSS